MLNILKPVIIYDIYYNDFKATTSLVFIKKIDKRRLSVTFTYLIPDQ